MATVREVQVFANQYGRKSPTHTALMLLERGAITLDRYWKVREREQRKLFQSLCDRIDAA